MANLSIQNLFNQGLAMLSNQDMIKNSEKSDSLTTIYNLITDKKERIRLRKDQKVIFKDTNICEQELITDLSNLDLKTDSFISNEVLKNKNLKMVYNRIKRCAKLNPKIRRQKIQKENLEQNNKTKIENEFYNFCIEKNKNKEELKHSKNILKNKTMKKLIEKEKIENKSKISFEFKANKNYNLKESDENYEDLERNQVIKNNFKKKDALFKIPQAKINSNKNNEHLKLNEKVSNHNDFKRQNKHHKKIKYISKIETYVDKMSNNVENINEWKLINNWLKIYEFIKTCGIININGIFFYKIMIKNNNIFEYVLIKSIDIPDYLQNTIVIKYLENYIRLT